MKQYKKKFLANETILLREFFFPTIMGLVYQTFRLDINISMYICKIVMIKMIRNYLVELLIGKLSFKNIRKKKDRNFSKFFNKFFNGINGFHRRKSTQKKANNTNDNRFTNFTTFNRCNKHSVELHSCCIYVFNSCLPLIPSFIQLHYCIHSSISRLI